MNIALLGYGTVGKSVEKLCIKKGITISHILRRDASQLSSDNMTTDIDKILYDPAVETIVECLSGIHPAYDYVKKGLEHKKNIVTSNKKMLAHNYLDLLNCAKVNNRKLLFSSACGGGIPWIFELNKIAMTDTIYSFKGIMNGTSNYILDNMINNHLNFSNALKKAQELGYAESDPSDDIDGIDTANKVVLSAGVAFKYRFNVDDMFIKGIRYINDEVINYCLKNNLGLVLLGKGLRNQNSFSLSVTPTIVKKDSLFSNIRANYNCFTINSEELTNLCFIGQGAGGIVTASNIIRDLLALKNTDNIKLLGENSIDYSINKSNYLISCKTKIDRKFIKERMQNNMYLTKKISINTLKKILNEEDAFIAEVEDD